MFDFIPDTIQQDSIPFFLKAGELPLKPDSVHFGFGEFEFLPSDSAGLLFAPDSVLTAHAQMWTDGKAGVLFSFSPIAESIFSLVFLSCILLLSLIFRKEGAALAGNFKNIFSSSGRNLSVYKEQITTTEVWGEVFLVLQTITLLSIIVFTFFWERLSTLPKEMYYVVFGGTFLALLVFVGLKYLMYKIIGTFFFRENKGQWIERYFWIMELLGLALFIPVILYVYLLEFRNIIQISIIIIFFISRLLIVAGLLNIFVKNRIGLFYFIVYLCGTEIAPYILFFKGVFLIIKIVGNTIL